MTLSPFAPPCIVQNGRMQQPLCHLYFLTLMENRNLKDKNLYTLVCLGRDVKRKLQCATDGEAVLLQLEFQAIIQILTQQLALHLDPSQSDRLGDVYDIKDEINRYDELNSIGVGLGIMSCLWYLSSICLNCFSLCGLIPPYIRTDDGYAAIKVHLSLCS